MNIKECACTRMIEVNFRIQHSVGLLLLGGGGGGGGGVSQLEECTLDFLCTSLGQLASATGHI